METIRAAPLFFMLAACAGPCAGVRGTPQLTAQLFMGGDVADAEWQDFLGTEVTPRFPDGLSVVATDGRWRTPAGQQIREHSRLLIIVMPKNQTAAIQAIADSYKQRFHQQSVGVVFTDACAAF